MDGHLDTLRGKRIRRRFEQSRLEPQMTALAYKVAWPLTRLRLEPADGEASAPQAPGQAANRARRQAAGA